MTDETLEYVFHKLKEETRYKVICRTKKSTFGIYVAAINASEAIRKALKKVSGAVIERVEEIR